MPGFQRTHLCHVPRSGQGLQLLGGGGCWLHLPLCLQTPVLPGLCFSPDMKQSEQKSFTFKKNHMLECLVSISLALHGFPFLILKSPYEVGTITTNEETQKSEVTCSRSHSQMVEMHLNLVPSVTYKVTAQCPLVVVPVFSSLHLVNMSGPQFSPLQNGDE